MDWSPEAWSVWGKLSPISDGWMPLVTHLEDSSAVAGYIWDEFLPVATRSRICEALGIPDEEGRRLVSWLAGVHDVGKATPAFAAKAAVIMPSVLDSMRDQGLDARPTPEDRRVAHATAGQLVLERWLASGYPNSLASVRVGFACIVGCHHGTTPNDAVLGPAGRSPAQLGQGRWVDVRNEILDHMAEATCAGRHLDQWLTHRIPVPIQALLTGVVIMADWIASNTDYFPYSGDRATADRMEAAAALLDLPPPWAPSVPEGNIDAFIGARFASLSGRTARPLQERLVATAREVTQPALFIVEGPMGVGKTEAALLAAEVLAERFGLGGVFIGLPTMATANPMFTRVKRWLATTLNGRDASLSLAHGKAALNDEYVDLLRHRWVGQVYDDAGAGDLDAAVVVNQWLRGRKRTGLADFVVGTIDQALFAALKAKHVVLRHLGLAGKVVIIDEVHAADDYMREYLKRLLVWLGAYRTPVILMSATLPPAQRDEFLNAYAYGVDRIEGISTAATDDYPRITVYDGVRDGPDVPVPSDASELRVTLRTLPDELPALAELLRHSLVAGGCAAVICNTVTRAQEAFAALQPEFGADVQLVHSRFIAPERARRETELVGLLGPEAEHRPQRLIVVGTQVLEQSLDVDFDLMVTDLAPMDLVLQRSGRLHRHHREHRPDPVSTPTLWLRGVVDVSATPPMAVKGSRAVYGTHRLLLAAAGLAGVESLHLPSDIPRLVRLAYDQDAVPPAGWEEAWRGSEEREFTERLRTVGRARTYLLEDPWIHGNLNGLIDVDGGDPDKHEEQGTSQVRDSDEGLEVMALWRGEDQLLRLPEGATRFPGRVVSEGVQWGTADDERLAREMAACTLRLPALMCYPGVIDQVIAALEKQADYSGWQNSRWVGGELAVVFDASGICHVAGFDLSYDPDQGLQVVRAKESHQ